MALQKSLMEQSVGVQMDSQPVECGCYEGAKEGESYLYGDDVTDKLAAFVVKSSKDCDADPLCPIKKLLASKRDACLNRPKIAGKKDPEFICFLTNTETATTIFGYDWQTVLVAAGLLLLVVNLAVYYNRKNRGEEYTALLTENVSEV